MNLQKRTLKRLKKLLIEERWFNNAEFDSLFVHTYLNTKALVLGHKSSIVILMDKRCDVLRISESSIKETGEEILKAGLMLREKLKVDIPSPFQKLETYAWEAASEWARDRPVPVTEIVEEVDRRQRDRCVTEDMVEVPNPDFVVTLPPSEHRRIIDEVVNEGNYTRVGYETFVGITRTLADITQGEDE